MVADGKVYIGTRAGEFDVLAASREKRVISSFQVKRADQCDGDSR